MKKTLFIMIVMVFTVVMALAGISCKEEAATGNEEAATGEETVETATSEEVVITMWDWQGGTGIDEAYKKIIANFEADNPGVTVKHTSKTYGAYETELKAALTAGEAPDIFGVYPGTGVAEAAQEGSLVDIKSYVMEDQEWLDWMGNAIDFSEIYYEDGMYVVPQDRIAEIVWYWTDLAEDAGITKAPVTIDDYAALLPDTESKGMQLMIAGFNEGTWVYMDTFSNYVHQQQEMGDEELIQAAMDGKVSWQQPEFVIAMNAIKKLFDSGVFTEDAFSFDYQVQTMGGWYNRDAIFGWIFGNWAVPSVPEDFINDVGMVHFPLIDDSYEPTYNIGVGTDAGVYSGSENKEAAIAFLKETFSPESAEIFIENGTTPPSELKEIPQTGNPVFESQLKIMMEAKRYFTFYYTNPELYDALGNAIGKVCIGQATPEEVLTELDDMME